jgi:thioredoxin-like negative regulator of GroEL
MDTNYVCVSKRIQAAAPLMMQTAALIVYLWFLAPMVYGQFSGVSADLVECPGTVQPADSGATAVELEGAMGVSYRADVDPSGHFRFSRIPAGDYSGRILGWYGNTIDSIVVSIQHAMPMLTLRLPEVPRTNPHAETISVARLEHKIAPKARKEVELADRAEKKKDTATAIDHLQKAIALDPGFMEAHNSLGIRYISTGEDDRALTEFRAALELDPRNSGLQANVSAVLLRLRQPAEAENAARRSVDLDGSNPRAHYLLALALVDQRKITPEVEKNLRAAADELPVAHLLLGKVFIDSGRLEEGAVELRSYLASHHLQGRAEAEAWLKNLEENRVQSGCRFLESEPRKSECAPSDAVGAVPAGQQ